MKELLFPYLRIIRLHLRRYIFAPTRRYFGRKIPIAMITGTKGKTTTTRMLSHILTKAGHKTGYASTDGVVINGEYIVRDDLANYEGARMVLNQPSITAAILETARGGLLKLGLYRDRCNVAALLNVGREQIGMDGIETVEEMALLKKKVIDTAREAIVLNADDAQCCKMIRGYPKCQVILFSLENDNQVVDQHVKKGGVAYVLSDSKKGEIIERRENDSTVRVISISDLPSSGNGVFPQNIANAMAAAALAEALKIPMPTIKEGLHTYENSGGHLSFLKGYKPTVLLDRIPTVPSSIALAESVRRIKFSGRKVCMITTVGNRPDWYYKEIGEALAPIFDHFVCYDIENYRRGRAPGEIPELLESILVNTGVSANCVYTAKGYEDATFKLAQTVREKDLVVIMAASDHQFLPIFRKHFAPFSIESKG